MKDQTIRRSLHSAIYTRASTEQELEQDFNSLDAQREACEAHIKSQAHEPQLLQLIPYAVTLLALLAVGVRKTRARNRHGAWHFEL
jgi:hypothetical protein